MRHRPRRNGVGRHGKDLRAHQPLRQGHRGDAREAGRQGGPRGHGGDHLHRSRGLRDETKGARGGVETRRRRWPQRRPLGSGAGLALLRGHHDHPLLLHPDPQGESHRGRRGAGIRHRRRGHGGGTCRECPRGRVRRSNGGRWYPGTRPDAAREVRPGRDPGHAHDPGPPPRRGREADGRSELRDPRIHHEALERHGGLREAGPPRRGHGQARSA